MKRKSQLDRLYQAVRLGAGGMRVHESPEEWTDRMQKESWRNKTVLDARKWSGPGVECNMCRYFDLDESKCAQGKRPTKMRMLDGPNEEAHFHKSCRLFQMADDDEIDTDTSGVDRYFSV